MTPSTHLLPVLAEYVPFTSYRMYRELRKWATIYDQRQPRLYELRDQYLHIRNSGNWNRYMAPLIQAGLVHISFPHPNLPVINVSPLPGESGAATDHWTVLPLKRGPGWANRIRKLVDAYEGPQEPVPPSRVLEVWNKSRRTLRSMNVRYGIDHLTYDPSDERSDPTLHPEIWFGEQSGYGVACDLTSNEVRAVLLRNTALTSLEVKDSPTQAFADERGNGDRGSKKILGDSSYAEYSYTPNKRTETLRRIAPFLFHSNRASIITGERENHTWVLRELYPDARTAWLDVRWAQGERLLANVPTERQVFEQWILPRTHLHIARKESVVIDTLGSRIREKIDWEPAHALQPRKKATSSRLTPEEAAKRVAVDGLVHTWHTAYNAKFKVSPIFAAKDRKMFKTLVSTQDQAILRAAIDYFIGFVTGQTDWLVDHYGHTVTTFYKVLPMILEKHGDWVRKRAVRYQVESSATKVRDDE